MKKRSKITLFVTIIILIALFFIFKSNYGFIIKNKDGIIVSYVFSSEKNRKYLESMPTCYDESYHYDINKNITILRAEYNDSFILNKIKLRYKKNNLCEREFILNENFINEIIEKADIEEITLEICEKEKCKTRQIKNNITNLLKEINKEKYIKENINITIPENYKTLISIYYNLNEMDYILNIFKINNYIVLKNIDANDHPKNIKYNFNNNIENEINNIVNENKR